jgi:hypothetical protein
LPECSKSAVLESQNWADARPCFWSLKIASQKVGRFALSNSSNVEIVGWKANDEWLTLYRCADENKLQP